MAGITSVCVYCGSRFGADRRHRGQAVQLGRRLARAGMRLVYGGGQVGLMGAIADAVLAEGGQVTGIIPEHLERLEVEHRALTELHVVPSMHDRKRLMFELSDAFVALPGGIGTLDESFEILSWRQLKLHDQPLIFLNDGGYWQLFADLVDHIIASGFAPPETTKLFEMAENMDQVFEILARTPKARGKPDSTRL
jgi:uncharacterized protein (TIGR00730 family)